MKFMTIVKCAEIIRAAAAGADRRHHGARRGSQAGGRLRRLGRAAADRQGARARIAKGKLTITDGPFTEAKEVIGGFTTYDVASKEEAMVWVRRFMELHLKHWPEWEGELELRPMFEEPPAGD